MSFQHHGSKDQFAAGSVIARRSLLRKANCRVLLFDEEYLAAEILGEVLEDRGFAVTVCRTVADFLRQLKSGRYSAAMISTPGDQANIGEMIAMARRIRPRLPMVVVSDSGIKLPGKLLQAVVALPKAFSVNDVVPAVNNALDEAERWLAPQVP